MVGAQDYALFRLCFCEGHRTLLPPSCHLVQKRECNVDAPLGPEQDLKLLFPCNPKDPLRISIKIRLDYVNLFTVLWAMGLPLHLAVPPPPPFPSQLAMCRLGVPPLGEACTSRVERGRGEGGGKGRGALLSARAGP